MRAKATKRSGARQYTPRKARPVVGSVRTTVASFHRLGLLLLLPLLLLLLKDEGEEEAEVGDVGMATVLAIST